MSQHAANDHDSGARQEWAQFCLANPQDAALFVRMLAVCEGHTAEAVVLWDLIRHHRKLGLQPAHAMSAHRYLEIYGSQLLPTKWALLNASKSLDSQGLIEMLPVVRNTPRRLRLLWPALEDALKGIDSRAPGLRVMP